jgi:hypothetical protein
MRRLAAAALLLACSKPHRGELDEDKAKGVFDKVVIDTPPGISGMAAGSGTELWMIPERDRFLVRFDGGKTEKFPIAGVPDGMDTEDIAVLGDDTFALALEGQDVATAAIAIVKGSKVVEVRPIDTVKLTMNHGAEAVCGHGGDMLVGIEQTETINSVRSAPLVRFHRDGVKYTVARLRLTTDTGKISALDCQFDADGTAHVLAIERHYGVHRLLAFDAAPDATDITPRVVLDLAPILNDSLNLEGLAHLPDGRLVAVNDNQTSQIDGPTYLLTFAPGIGK